MRILFFDMEFADGKVPGSVYSFGYVVTDEKFRIKEGPCDLLINPESSWNFYVRKNILAYPIEQVHSSPNFASHYKKIKRLFDRADVAVGFAVGNDVKALYKDCKRYSLPPLEYKHFDTELLCRLIDGSPRAKGLGKCVEEWCGRVPENQHRSDGDALATMMLFEALCKKNHVTPEMMMEAYPECCGSTFKKRMQKKKTSLWRRLLKHIVGK